MSSLSRRSSRSSCATGGSIIFTVLMPWFISTAMEPAVARLARHMRRGAATGLVMAAFVVLAVVFAVAFGQLLVEQVATLLKGLPDLVKGVVGEPRISAKATNVNPAVAFASVLVGAALFGPAGALLAVPVVAMLLSLVHIYIRRHELIPQVLDHEKGAGPSSADVPDAIDAAPDDGPHKVALDGANRRASATAP